MRDVARDPAALEQLRVQWGRLADRLRPRWWYLAGIAFLWALVFAAPFGSRYLPRGLAPSRSSWSSHCLWPACCTGARPGPPA